MARTRSKAIDVVAEAEGVLRRQPVRAIELVTAIHAVNPTGLGLAAHEERLRYDLKSRLQSRLILEFFDDLEVQSTDRPEVIGLRFRPQNRDAAHAVMADLDAEARSRVQLHLDTLVPAEPRSERPEARSRVARGGRLEAGRRALAEYDYDTARACFEDSLIDSDDDSAAVALLELLVEQLAAWLDALEVEARLVHSQRTAPVRALLAVAAAHLGDVLRCRSLASDGDPRFAVAFCILTEHELRAGNQTAAEESLAVARTLAPGSPEVIAAEGELARFKAAQRAPLERELEAALSGGDEQAAERTARSILSRWPESAPARRVIRDAEAKLTVNQIDELVGRAQAAYEREDDVTALSLWSQALGLGAPSLENSMKAASARIESRRRQGEVDAVVAGLRNGATEQSLSAYLALDVAARKTVRHETGLQTLSWLEEIDSSAAREWPLNIAAVLALATATELGVSECRAVLAPHEARVRRIERGRLLLAQAEAQQHQVELERDHEALEVSRGAFAAGRWREVIALSQGIHPAEHREHWRQLAAQSQARLDADARVTAFDALVAQGNALGALAVMQSNEWFDTSDRELWATRRRTLSPHLHRALAMQVGDAPDALRACDFANVGRLQSLSYALDAKGEFAWWVTALGGQLFLRKISVREERVVLLVALSPPQRFSMVDAQVEGETLRLVSQEGAALAISTRTCEVTHWHHMDLVAEGEVLEAAVIVPGGRFEWLSIRNPTGEGELLRVVDLSKDKVLRATEREGLGLELVITAGGPRVWLSGFHRPGVLYEPGGATEATFPPGVEKLSVAPTGTGLIAICRQGDPDDATTDGEPLQVLHLRSANGPVVLVEELEDSDGDSTVLVATSLEQKASFVLWISGDGVHWLSAYADEGGVLRRRWRVRCPQACLLLQDLEARHVVLVTARGTGLRCASLGAEPPNFDDVDPDATELPMLSPFERGCPGPFDETLFAFAARLHLAPPGERQRLLSEVLETYRDRPDELAFLAGELWRFPDERERVLGLLKERFPDHASLKLSAAAEALKVRRWQAALDALEPARPSSSSGHVEHLRGKALYELERLGEAREAFSFALDAGCRVEGWPEWLDALMGKSIGGKAGQLVSIVREARAALSEGRGRDALALLDVPLVWASFDVQLGAQLTVAALDSQVGERGGQMRARLIIATFLEQASMDRPRLPIGHLGLSPQQLVDVSTRAQDWLDELVRS